MLFLVHNSSVEMFDNLIVDIVSTRSKCGEQGWNPVSGNCLVVHQLFPFGNPHDHSSSSLIAEIMYERSLMKFESILFCRVSE